MLIFFSYFGQRRIVRIALCAGRVETLEIKARERRVVTQALHQIRVDDEVTAKGHRLPFARLQRITRARAVEAVVGALKRIKPADLKVGALATLQASDPKEIVAQIEAMAEASGKPELTNAIAAVKEDL